MILHASPARYVTLSYQLLLACIEGGVSIITLSGRTVQAGYNSVKEPKAQMGDKGRPSDLWPGTTLFKNGKNGEAKSPNLNPNGHSVGNGQK